MSPVENVSASCTSRYDSRTLHDACRLVSRRSVGGSPVCDRCAMAAPRRRVGNPTNRVAVSVHCRHTYKRPQSPRPAIETTLIGITFSLASKLGDRQPSRNLDAGRCSCSSTIKRGPSGSSLWAADCSRHTTDALLACSCRERRRSSTTAPAGLHCAVAR